MKTTVKWYFSKEAKRGRVGHLAGHARLGAGFSRCGKRLAQECSSFSFKPCGTCEAEQANIAEREAKRRKMEQAAPKAPAPETPELNKMAAVQRSTKTINGFLDWLQEEGIQLCTTKGLDGQEHDYPREDGRSREKLLADYLGIDLKKVEEERRALLDSLRTATKALILAILPIFASGCGTLRQALQLEPRHRHSVEKADYVFPCIIEDVRFEVYKNAAEANAKCATRGKETIADDGKPLGDGYIIEGCFWPTITVPVDEPMKISGTIVTHNNPRVIADEIEHLIFAACRAAEKEEPLTSIDR